MSDLVTMSVEHHPRHQVITLRGEIDISNSDEVLRRCRAGLHEGAVVVDLSGVEYLDSAGVRGLDELHAQAGSLGRTLVLVASPIVRRILELTAIDRTVVVYDTLFDANQAAAGAASLQSGPPPDGLT